jgi:hypothetical protein
MPSHPGLGGGGGGGGPDGPPQPWASMCLPPGFCRFAAVVDVVDWADGVDGG